MKDESQNEEEVEGEIEEVLDQFSSLSDHEFHETNGHDSLTAEGEDSDAQLDHSLINSLSASREKFPTSKFCFIEVQKLIHHVFFFYLSRSFETMVT